MKRLKGIALEDGIHHDHDHESCSRRDFISRMGLMAAGGAFLLNSTPVKALESSSLFQKLANLETDRVLVLLQLNGGNDGLNTLVPIENDDYYNLRPGIAINKNDAIRLNDTNGLHPSMQRLTPLWNEGKMGIIQNVGYPEPNLSHFRSTDIWMSSSDSEEVIDTGWAGRFLEGEFPDFLENPTEKPLAVQIGSASSLLFRGAEANMAMNVANVDLLEQITQDGIVYNTEGLPDTAFGNEMAYVRSVANAAYRYSDAIQDSFQQSSNTADFANNELERSLAVVSRLIKGDLNSRIYLVSLGGFDTHASQANTHSNLLNTLSSAVKNFYDDLEADSKSEDVLIMTFSEFGRRVFQNNSQGTDHGTAAPLFIFGDKVAGGIYGEDTKLGDADLDDNYNLVYETDFRQIYSTILNEWFELDESTTSNALGGDFEKVPFLAGLTTSIEDFDGPTSIQLNQNYPNPFNPNTTISFSLPQSEEVQLDVFDVQGRRVTELANQRLGAGEHSFNFNAANLASGVYIYRLRAGRFVQTKTMTLIK